MAKVAILGAGVMGSAMAMPLAHGGHEVHLVGTPLDEAIVQAIVAGRPHPGLKIHLGEHVTAHPWTALQDVVASGVDLLVLGVSSAGVGWAIDRLSEAPRAPVPVVVLTKGLVGTGDTIELIPTIVRRDVSLRTGLDLPTMAIGGPCIAGELAAKRDTHVVLTGTDSALLERTRDMLQAPFYHVHLSPDVPGVEVCAAFKNFFALGVGAAASTVERLPAVPNGAAAHNVVATAFTRAVAELAVLVEAVGGDRETAFGLAGVGDLHVTCTAGRNSRMGRLLGQGVPYSRAKAERMPTDTVEGAQLALTLDETLRRMMVRDPSLASRLPLTNAILGTVCRDEIIDILAI
jgi:glycerol-3-phosphate dehydrogenase (NAD(P)+)